MAKWGEGDPRWIVEDRADATNVNNWHWTEKNANGWSKDKLRSLLEGLRIQDDNYTCEIKDITKLEGEASANNRKAKLIFFYEWDIKANWKGKLSGGDKHHKGSIAIPNLSDEHDPKEVDIDVSINDEKSDDAYKLKEFMRTKGPEVVREKLATYIRELKEEFSQGMILPAKEGSSSKKVEPTTESKNTAKEKLSQPIVESGQQSSVGVKIHCKKIKDTLTFKCQAADIYRALTEKDMVRAFTRGDVTIEAEKGGRFVLFGGNIMGEFINLDPHKLIHMKWRYKFWPEEHYSDVKITLDEKDDCTELKLIQTGVPESDYERTLEGWKTHYWESIKQTFGFGSRLF